MALTLDLSPEEEARLRSLSEREGVSPEDYVLRLIRRSFPAGTQARLNALRSLLEGDEAEQKETGAYLLQALDEDRLSDRKLFP